MVQIYQMFFGWMPAIIQAAILGLFAYLIILLVLKIVKIILDSLPFV